MSHQFVSHLTWTSKNVVKNENTFSRRLNNPAPVPSKHFVILLKAAKKSINSIIHYDICFGKCIKE